MSNKSFVDIAYITVRSGKGGNGAVSFRREKYIPKGGPDGGNGGKGGDIVFQGLPYLHSLSLLTLKKDHNAENGLSGTKSNKHGRNGKDVVLTVPYGTIIKDTQERVIASITEEQSRVVLLKGGKGGKGNVCFKNSVRQAPRFAQDGKAGVVMDLVCELEIIAYVGLIGMPNVGKSTMLQALTQANPKIGSYPFTTLHPNLGVLRNYEKEVIIADIPGLVEGASRGEGLGLTFLKHCKKTKLLVFVLDPLIPLIESESKDVVHDISTHLLQQYRMLMNELRVYDASLAAKSKIIIINKVDACYMGTDKDSLASLVTSLDTMVQHTVGALQEKEHVPILCCSSHVGLGISELKNTLINFNTEEKAKSNTSISTVANTI